MDKRIFNMSKGWLAGILSFILCLALVSSAVGIGDLPAQAAEGLQLAPLNPDFLEFQENPPEPFYGYIPPPMDLSHLDEIPVERARGFATLPSSFDWRATGKVTSIKNQNPCGTCWVHGTLAAVESKVLIEESVSPQPDYSEQNLACCTDPAWAYLIGNRCMGGGWSWLAADTLTKKGSRLEACQPYNTGTIDTEACDDSCDSIKMITDYRMIADPATSPGVVAPIKDAVYNHGPLAMSYAADDPPNPHMYPGGIYYWPDCPQNEVNHLVCIIGWDNDIEWPDHSGYGAWIVKNSWGTGWENSGYFYLCYGSAGMCEVASLDYKDYDADEQVYYWDEAGQVGAAGCSAPSAWMANIFTSTQDGSLTHVDFWTTSNNAQYDIYVYLDDDISDGLDNQATSQSGTCQEFGYYSIPLSSPVSLSNGQSFIIAVKMTTPGFNHPLPVEHQYTTIVDPTIQTGVSYARCGDTGAWDDVQPYGWNVCLRARVTTEAAIVAPTVTTNAATLVEETTATGHGDITSTGGETCDKRGVCWSISSGPDISDSKSEESGTYGTGAFTASMTGLAQGTKYYVKAYAHNSAGYGYGNEVTFTTKPDKPTDFSATTASSTQIDLSWTKGAGAQKTMIRRSTVSNPTAPGAGDQVYFDTGTAKSDTGLNPGTHYYYSAWSWVQGSDVWSDAYDTADATTTPIETPTVTTAAVSAVEETTATGHGDITSTGGETCDKRGVCWSISSGPDISDSKSEESGAYGTGAFTASMTGLAQGTKYYVRAYAHNSAGYGYGNEVTFTTKPDAPTDFSATTASTTQIDLSWTKGDGAQRTKIQREEGSYPANKDDGTQVYFDTGSSKSDTGLTPGTTYYYRAWSYVQGSEQWSDDYAQDSATTTAIIGLMEGDASQNGCVSIGDAMFIAQYRFGLRSFSASQLECADTTDNGSITMGDAMHIAQWLFDPDGSLGMLFEPLWKSPDDDHMLPPQRC